MTSIQDWPYQDLAALAESYYQEGLELGLDNVPNKNAFANFVRNRLQEHPLLDDCPFRVSVKGCRRDCPAPADNIYSDLGDEMRFIFDGGQVNEICLFQNNVKVYPRD